MICGDVSGVLASAFSCNDGNATGQAYREPRCGQDSLFVMNYG